MPLTLPELDDRRFDDLMAEARALIPSLAPEWTNHNLADPGITILELFAWLTEVLLYRLNRISEANVRTFLRLLNGPDWVPSSHGHLEQDIRETVLALRHCDRAVTPNDYEILAREADPRVARAHCIPRRNLTDDPDRDAPGHVSVVVVPVQGPLPEPELLSLVQAYLEPRRMLTIRQHVCAPRLVRLSIAMMLHLQDDALGAEVRLNAERALRTLFDPIVGGHDGAGWPLGRCVYLSEIVATLESVPGVDFVGPIEGKAEISANTGTTQRDASGSIIGVTFAADQLATLEPDSTSLTLTTAKRR